MDVKKDIRFRVYVAFLGMCAFGGIILAKAAYIQVSEGRRLRTAGEKNIIKSDTLTAERGNIYSEDGSLLCSSIPQFDAYVDFTVIKKDTLLRYADTLAAGLAALYQDRPASYYRQVLDEGMARQRRYYGLRRNMSYSDYQTLRSLPVFRKGARRGGLIVEERIRRVNPYGMLAHRTIGLWRAPYYLKGKKVANSSGLEARYDSLLTGTDGTRLLEHETGNVWMPIQGTEIDPVHGKDVVTTLDLGIQDVAEHALESVVEQYQCAFGTCIVMEVATGKIKALVNLGRDSATGKYFENQNYALTRAEPGSTFKLATLISLLNDGYINVNDKVNCEGGQKQFANRTMHDSHHGLGWLQIKEAFAQSSNVGMASLAYRFYFKEPEKFIRHLRDLKLDCATGVDLLGEAKPVMIEPDDREWSATTLPWMATGYGIRITPLHTCMLYNALANNGKMMKPYLVSAIRESGKDIRTFEPVTLVEKIASDESLAQLRKCTEQVVVTGTAKHIASPHYAIAGKTGTAQVADRGISYSMGVYQGSFVGYFPADQPRYTIAIVIRTRAHSTAYYGGTIAAPVFRMISDKIFANGTSSSRTADNVLPHSQQMVGKLASVDQYTTLLQALGRTGLAAPTNGPHMVQLMTDSQQVPRWYSHAESAGTVPDVRGMGLRDAVYQLEKCGMRVQIKGSGSVLQQSVEAGMPAIKGQQIFILLG